MALAPTSMQRFAHPDGELAAARAAAATGTLMVVSSNAGTPFEDLAATGVSWWLQAYLTADRDLIVPTLRRAVDAGARAVVLTVDTPFPGPKRGIDDAAFGDLSQIYGVNHPDLVRGVTPGSEHARDLGPGDLVVAGGGHRSPRGREGCAARRRRPATAWPPAPPRSGCPTTAGASSTGPSARPMRSRPWQPPSADAAEVYVDGGLRSGHDVLAALGLGARAAFLGRLPLLALAAGGPEEVARVLTTAARRAAGGAPAGRLPEPRRRA